MCTSGYRLHTVHYNTHRTGCAPLGTDFTRSTTIPEQNVHLWVPTAHGPLQYPNRMCTSGYRLHMVHYNTHQTECAPLGTDCTRSTTIPEQNVHIWVAITFGPLKWFCLFGGYGVNLLFVSKHVIASINSPSTVYNLRIHLNSSIRMSNQKIHLPR